MSWEMLGKCSPKSFGNPSRKQVIMYLADKASANGEGIWCSKPTVARETELSLATVKRIFREFVREGILRETGTKDCGRGYTKVYRICVETVDLLTDLSKRHDDLPTGVSLNPVHCDPPSQVTMTPVGGSPRPPNQSQTILEPSVVDDAIADFWGIYPSERRRRFAQCSEAIRSAINEGALPSDIVDAAATYAASTKGHKPTHIFFSDNWLRQRPWEEYAERKHANAMVREQRAARAAKKYAAWITEGGPMCKHISPQQASEAIKRGLVTEGQARQAGVPL